MPTLERRVADLERELQSLRAWTRSGAGSSTYGGATTTRPLQVGFPAKITSTYSAATGYNWSMRLLTPGTATTVDPTSTVSGNGAVEVSGRTDIASGTKVWMEPDPNGRGFLFTVSDTGGGLTVSEVDLAPSYTSITTVRFDQADGFVVSQPAAGIARIDIQAANGTVNAGVVSTTTQGFGGDKSFQDKVYCLGYLYVRSNTFYINDDQIEAFVTPMVVYDSAYLDGMANPQPALYISSRTSSTYATPNDRVVALFYDNGVGSGYPGTLKIDGVIEFLGIADAAAPNSTLYYSTTANKLVYKDGGGTVNNLY